ncbi:MAG: Lon protease family protein, partial [Methanomassiliicoccus sp.]
EVLVDTTMPDTNENCMRLAQFVAQEIVMDGKIPHASREAIQMIIDEARKRAKLMDNKDKALTLRLRELGGLIRAAGDVAIVEGAVLIEAKHIKEALKRARPVEEQIKEKYGSFLGGVAKDISGSERDSSPYHYWNQHVHDDKQGYR